MKVAVCTLFEKHYHYGLGGLANSLFFHGYRGVIWAGYRGALPPWASPLQDAGVWKEFRVTEGFSIRFVPVGTGIHFANYKPNFMLEIFERYDPALEALFYFDPDIVIECRWPFYEEWGGFGLALVQEITNSAMPSDHPVRLLWKRHLRGLGLPVRREMNQYFNSGFVGTRREWLGSIRDWKTILQYMGTKTSLTDFMPGDRSSEFFAPDQDSLNAMAMCTDSPLSTIGPEGMDFVPGGFTMAHAVGAPKPWRKRMFLSAVNGKGPTMADRAYWLYADGPIAMFTRWQLWMHRLDNLLGAAVGRMIRRS